jgi:hypothetical protein
VPTLFYSGSSMKSSAYGMNLSLVMIIWDIG